MENNWERAGRKAGRDRLQELAKKVLLALAQDYDGKVYVTDPDYAEELLEMAAMYAE